MTDNALPPGTEPAAPAAAPAVSPSSPLARAALLAYALLIIYASWYPFSGWRDIGLSPLAFISARMPRYWTVFDAGVNVVGYVPFGLLLMFSLYPKVRGLPAIVLTIICGLLWSTTMEMVQTFLPSRVASNLDVLTNVSGMAIGAFLGAWWSRPLIEQSRLSEIRGRWCWRESTRGLTIVALWPLAQIYPQPYLFGHGQILVTLSDWLSDLLTTPIDLATAILGDNALTVEQYWLSETIVTSCGMAGALLAMLCLTKRAAPKSWLAAGLIVLALVVKTLATALLFGPENAFGWITPGAEGGILIGAILASGLAFAPSTAQRRLAATMLLISFVVVNIVPPNPYFVATLQDWVQGKFLNFNGAAQFLSTIWPFLALWFLSHPLPAYKTQKQK